MKAIVVEPGAPDSLELADIAEPRHDDGLLVEAVAVGICGTDHGIIEKAHGVVPPNSGRLVLGHESLGRVAGAPEASAFAAGDLVVGMVRRPDPVPCPCCAAGHWDMCMNGRYVERGIKEADGYGSESYVLEPEFAVPVDKKLGLRGVLVEPTSVVAKAWRKVKEFADLNCRAVGTVLVTGAGPIGLMAASIGRADGVEVHVLDRVSEGPKPELVDRLGAVYHATLETCPPTDVVIECTGVPGLIPGVLALAKPNSVVCLTGVSDESTQTVDLGALNRGMVLDNKVVFGSVNAHAVDYEGAIDHLGSSDQDWLDDVITRRVPLRRWREAYERRENDVKTVIVFDEQAQPI